MSAPPRSPPADADRGALVALSGLPGIGPARLRALVDGASAAEVWARLAAGELRVDHRLAAACAGASTPTLLAAWRAAAVDVDPAATLERHRVAGVEVLVPGDEHWPAALVDDPDPPAILFARGDPATGAAWPTVAIVGTRRCSRYGWDVANRFGAELAAAGVAVVSGLASGIDGAAHRGAIDAGGAPPVGVVASGLDVVYPPAHGRLWREVSAAGVLLSEAPLGTRPTRWRFPARNRILAALSQAVVVVESAATGGAMHTVDEAERRARPVLAVPGPVTSTASTGTNRLVADGATPACDVDDVLLALDLPTRPGPPAEPPDQPGGAAGRLLDALGWRPATLDQLVTRTGLDLGAVARVAAELEAGGWLAADGGWFERRR